MKRLFTVIFACFLGVSAFSQGVDDVTLVVSADGATKEEATQNALRSAIEQTYGTFVSANTSILNDALVKDEIVTVASGNIKSYTEINSMEKDGRYDVTLKATVSASKLVTFAQSKGATTEFAGATFMANIKLQELYKQNEKKALENLLVQLKEIIPTMYDRSLNVGQPRLNPFSNDYHAPTEDRWWDGRRYPYLKPDGSETRNYPILFNSYTSALEDENIYIVPMTLTMTENANAIRFWDVLFSTMDAIQLTQDDIKFYEDSNISYLGWGICKGCGVVDKSVMLHCDTLNVDFNPILLHGYERRRVDMLNLGLNFWQQIDMLFGTLTGVVYEKILNEYKTKSKNRNDEFDIIIPQEVSSENVKHNNEIYYSELLQINLDAERLKSMVMYNTGNEFSNGTTMSLYDLIVYTESNIKLLNEYNSTHKKQRRDPNIEKLTELIKNSKIKEIFAVSDIPVIHKRGTWLFGGCSGHSGWKHWILRSDGEILVQFSKDLMKALALEWKSFKIKDNCGGISYIGEEEYGVDAYMKNDFHSIYRGYGILSPCTAIKRPYDYVGGYYSNVPVDFSKYCSWDDFFYKPFESFSFNAFIKASDISKYTSFTVE